MAVAYLDSSAIVKLAVAERESSALRRYLRRRRPVASSALARAEVLRALVPAGSAAIEAGRRVLASIELIRVNHRILNAAGVLVPESLRTLDAIHLATAQGLGAELRQVVTYDDGMAEGARNLGMTVVSPA